MKQLSREGPPRLSPPLAVQIVALLIGALAAAQLATLALTVLLPPTPPGQYRLQDVASALGGLPVDVRGSRPLVRQVKPVPPSLRSAGWLVSERSSRELARLLGASEDDVRLLFYSPLPFAGSSGLALAPSRPLVATPVRRLSVAWEAERPPGGAFGGAAPGGFGGSPQGGAFGPEAGGATGAASGRSDRRVRLPGGAGSAASGGGGAGGFGGGAPPLWAQRLQSGAARDGGRPDFGAGDQAPAGSSAEGRSASGYHGLGPFTDAGGRDAGAGGGFGGLSAARLGARGGDLLSPRPTPGLAPHGAAPTTAIVRPGGLGGAGAGLPIGAALAGADLADGGVAQRPSAPSAAAGSRTAAPTRALDTRVRPVAPPASAQLAPAPTAALAAGSDSGLGARAAELGLIAPASVLADRTGDAAGWTVAPPQRQARGLFGLAPAPFVQGDFVAAVRTGPKAWVTVEPRPEPFPNSWQRRVALWFLLAAAMVVPLGWLFARRLARPLGAFAAAAERLGRDPSGELMTLTGPAEIGRAARAFNGMQARLKRFVDDRTGMVGAISHDLRTPLARMRFRIERVPPELKLGMLEDVRQMEEMISSVLTFIRNVSEPAARERVDLRSIVECVVDDAALVGGEAVLDPGDPLSVECDTLGVQRVLTNLVDNALKYGRRAEVRMYAEAGEAVAEVVDDGPGLPPEELERVFQPFYRSAASRTLNSGGIGLGLAVSRSIARAHGGDVRLSPGETGLVAQLRLPLALKEAA